jgi:ketosteroid isomerase-like protein
LFDPLHNPLYQNHNLNKMKKLLTILIALPFCLLNQELCIAQDAREAEIRNVESLQTEAILKNDTTALYKLWSPQIVVNNPYNNVVTLDQIKKIFASGKVGNTSSLDVNIEKITFVNDVAIVMGTETLTPKGSADYSGKTIIRRFTNIWMQEDGEWKLTARQATLTSVK